MARSDFFITGKPEMDGLLRTDPLALVIGMLLDQQIPMEWAFAGPYKLQERLGHLDCRQIAAMDVEEFVAVFCEFPALHRFPGSMGKRTHELCRHIADVYGGDAAKIWKGARPAVEVFARVRALPGYGEEKAQILMAILAKRFGKKPVGWEEVAGRFADATPRSVADIRDAVSLANVRAFKKEMKAAKKDKQGRPATV